MQTSGDVIDLDLGQPEGSEAGFLHPVIVIAAQRILDANPTVVHVFPLTSSIRKFHSEIVIQPDKANGADIESAAQCQHLREVSPQRIVPTRGNTRPLHLSQIRETLAVILDIVFALRAAPDSSIVPGGTQRRTAWSVT